MISQLKHLFVVALAFAATPAAHAQTIDFNAHTPAVDGDNPIVDSGYSFSFDASGWGIIQPGSSGFCCNINFNGTGALFADGSVSGRNASVTMTQVGGGAFAVSSLDASVFYIGAPNEQITVLGNFMGGGSISTVLSTSTTWMSYGLSGFQNLSSLMITANTPGRFGVAPGFGLDNIVVSAAVAPVPEPAAWALMITGFGMVGGALRRRRVAITYKTA